METPLPATHVNRLDSITLLKEQGFKGVDVDLATSLFEYGIAWRDLPETNEVLFIYRIAGEDESDSRFDRATFSKNTDIEKECNWAKFSDLVSAQGTTLSEWFAFPFEQKVVDVVNHYGWENVFGSSYWEGFTISED